MIENYSKMPEQRVPVSKKTKEWFKTCALAGINIALEGKNSIRATNEEMIRNYRIYDGLANTTELKKHFDTLGVANASYNPTFSTYSSIRNQINLLVGEAIERGDEYVIACLDSDSVNKKISQKAQKAKELITEVLNTDEITPDEIAARLEEFKSARFRSKEENAANKALNYYKALNSIDYLKTDGFRDLLVTGGFIFAVDKVNNSLKIRQCNMLRTFPVKNGRSNDVRDSELIVEVRYLNKAAIIDEFGEGLSQEDYKKILGDDYSTDSVGSSTTERENARKSIMFNNREDLEFFTGSSSSCTDIIDSDDNIRVARTVWAGYRKIYKRKYYDEAANPAFDFQSEFYKAKIDEGEVLTPLWVKEWHEVTVIGSDIITKAKVKDDQYRSKSNPFECYSGYVGRFSNISDNKTKSLIDLVFPLLFLKDMTFARIEDIMAKNIGKVIELDISKKPKSWTIKKWLFWTKVHGIKVVDSFNEGDKGLAQGKLAGMYNPSSRPVDMDISGQIQNYLQWIQYIDQETDKVIGITPQRMGTISQRDAVSNVEASRIGSSLVTEIWFNVFERGIIDLYEIIIEASKDMIGTDVKLQAVLDDFSYSILNSDEVDYRFSEIGIFPIKARKFAKLRQIIEQIAINAIPNGQMSQTELFSLFRSGSIIEMMDKQERLERENKLKAEKRLKEEQQARMQEIQANQKGLMDMKQVEFNFQLEMEKAKGDIQIRLEQVKAEARLREAELINTIKFDANQNGVDDTVEIFKARMNMENSKADRELKAEEMKSNTELRIAELKLKEKELDIKSKSESRKI